MSKNAKIVIGVLVILVLIALAYSLRGTGTPVGETDSSDQAVRDDTAAIDADMQGLEGDRAVIDQGLETNVSAQ